MEQQEKWFDEVASKGADLDREIRRLVSEQPLVAMAAALGAGALGAFWLRRRAVRGRTMVHSSSVKSKKRKGFDYGSSRPNPI